MNNSSAIILYVDTLDFLGFMSFTRDPIKIVRNIDAMGPSIAQKAEIELAISKNHIYGIHCIGDFTCLFNYDKNNEGYMLFIKDRLYKTDDELEHFLYSNKGFPSEIISQYINAYRSSLLRLRSSSDLVRLSL